MVKITIGGRDLDVVPESLGFERKKLNPWRAKNRDALARLMAAEGETAAAAAAAELRALSIEGLLIYLEQNDGVSAEWLEDFIPMDPDEQEALLWRVLVAAGRKRPPPPAAGAPQPGEAKGQ